MANQYFVFKKQPEIGEDFTIDDKAAVHHIFTVMRTSVGEKIQLVFEEGKVGLAEVVSSELCTVRLLEVLEVQTGTSSSHYCSAWFP